MYVHYSKNGTKRKSHSANICENADFKMSYVFNDWYSKNLSLSLMTLKHLTPANFSSCDLFLDDMFNGKGNVAFNSAKIEMWFEVNVIRQNGGWFKTLTVGELDVDGVMEKSRYAVAKESPYQVKSRLKMRNRLWNLLSAWWIDESWMRGHCTHKEFF